MLGKISINGGISVQWCPISTTDYGEGIIYILIFINDYVYV